MKELYIAPELELLCFAAEERLASGDDGFDVEFSGLLQDAGGVSANPNIDIDIPISSKK